MLACLMASISPFSRPSSTAFARHHPDEESCWPKDHDGGCDPPASAHRPVSRGPGGYSPGHTHPKSAFIYATVLEGEISSQINDGPLKTYKARESFSELPWRPSRRLRECQQDQAGEAPRRLRGGHERDGTHARQRRFRRCLLRDGAGRRLGTVPASVTSVPDVVTSMSDASTRQSSVRRSFTSSRMRSPDRV